MSERIEIWIQKNRTELDTELPSEAVWGRICADLDGDACKVVSMEVSTRSNRRWYKAAAAVLVGMGLSVGAGWWMRGQQARADVAIMPDNLRKAQAFYTERITRKVAELEDKNPDPVVMEDLQQLDEVRSELLRELSDAPISTREEILKTLMDNYQIKLQILERVLEHSEKNLPDNSNNVKYERL